MAPKRLHAEMSSTTQDLHDNQLGKSNPSTSRVCPSFVLQDIFPNEIITMILEHFLQSPTPIRLLNRLHASPPLEKQKGDQTKSFWEQGEGIFHGALTASPSPRRDALRARFLAVNTFIVDRMTEHRMQHSISCHPRYIGSVLDEWPDSYQYIRSLIINGKHSPIERRDAVARACPNLTHLKILDLPSYVPKTYKQANRKVAYGAKCMTGARHQQDWARPPLGSGQEEQALLDFVSHPKLRHLEFQLHRYYTAAGTSQVTEAGRFAYRITQEVVRAFGRAAREVRIDILGHGGQLFVPFCLRAGPVSLSGYRTFCLVGVD